MQNAKFTIYNQGGVEGALWVVVSMKPVWKSKGLPTLTSSLIGQQLVAFLAAALKASHRVSTHMITSPIVKTALINICGKRKSSSRQSQKKKKEN